MKKLISVVLVLVMLFSLSVSSFADNENKAAQILGAELKLLASSFNTLKQADVDYNGAKPYYYAVTDLDHNNRIELLAFCPLDAGGNTSMAKAWEINETGTAFEPLNLPMGLPNLLNDSAETIYSTETGAWYYFVKERIELPGEADKLHELISVFTLTNGKLDNGTLAQAEHVMENGLVRSRYCVGQPGDANFRDIDEATYLNYVNVVYPNTQKTNTAFDWFKADQVKDATRFADSFGVFRGEKTDSKDLVNTQPVATTKFVSVTKNPTSENRKAGETAYFVANAVNYDSLSWTFVAPGGQQYSVQQFRSSFPGSTVSGEYGTTLSISNVSTGMSGWGAFCSFNGSGQNARSTTAYLYVQNYENLKKNDLNNFYATMAYLYGAWSCPVCGNTTYGDYCAYCGFDPDYYYYQYYLSSYPYDSVYNIYGLTDQELMDLAILNSMTDEDWALLAALADLEEAQYYDDPTVIWAPDYYDWTDYIDYDDWYEDSFNVTLYCPNCSSSSYDGSYCYNCGYPYLQTVDTWDYSNSNDWLDWTDYSDWGSYSGGGDWGGYSDWGDYSGGGDWGGYSDWGDFDFDF